MPWSTANEDLVELFETTGQVELAEILFEGTRSKGMGVVQFSNIPEAETAIGQCSCYVGLLRLTLSITQPNSKIICTVEDRWVRVLLIDDSPRSELTLARQMSDSMTVGTPLLRPLPRVVRASFQTKAYNLESVWSPLTIFRCCSFVAPISCIISPRIRSL